VFVDGCFWHACPVHATWPKANGPWWRSKILANVARDRDTDSRLKKAGWKVLRFWEHENSERAARSVARVVRRRRPAVVATGLPTAAS
jgi:DNA mismatch endonuclease (patch repair protein)